MATVARMLVELAGDPSGLRRAFQQSVRDAQSFAANIRQATSTAPLVDSARARQQGREAGEGMVKSFTAAYETRMATARESMARGFISPNAFRVAGEQAAREFNDAILHGIADLRQHKMLPPDVHAKMVRELKEVGDEAGRQAREALEAQLESIRVRAGTGQAIGQAITATGREVAGVGRSAFAGVTLPLAAVGGASVKFAADAAESANKFDVTFGRAASNVRGQLDALHREIPATGAQLQDMAAQFQALLQPMGFTAEQAARMSVRMVKLTGDITSFHNIPVQEAITRLFSGLVGETEAVRRFGVDISETRLKILAHNAGLGENVQALTRAQKTQLIYNEILRSTSVVTDDAKNTANSAANVFRFFTRDLQEAGITIGNRLLPTIVPLVQSLADVVERLARVNPATLDWAIKLALLAAAAGPVLIVLGNFMVVAGGIVRVFVAARAALAAYQAVQAAVAAGTLLAAGGAGTLSTAVGGILTALAGPAGLILLLGAAVAVLAAWAAHARAAKLDVDALARSFEHMNQAQLTARLQEETGKQQALLQEQARLRAQVGSVPSANNPNAFITGGGNATAVGQLDAINRKVEEQQALVNGLGTALNTLAARRNEEGRAEQQAIARADAYMATLRAGLGALGQTTTETRAAAKAQREHLQELNATISSLGDLYKIGRQFGQNVNLVEVAAVRVFEQVQRELDATGGRFDATTAKLLNMKEELLKLFPFLERAEALRVLDLPKLVQQTPTATQRSQAEQAAAHVPVAAQVGNAPQPITAANLPTRVTTPPPELNEWTTRTRLALAELRDAAKATARGFLQAVAPLGTALLDVLNPVRFFGSIMQEIAGALRPIFEPLRPVLTQLAKVIGETLGPVMEALAPVIQALIPIVRAVMQVLAPILQALAPLFKAFIPLLEAMFPIFKLVAIAATYVGQAFGIVANIVLRAVGNIIIGFGKIVEALARGIDALPFVSAKHAIDVGIGIQNFGRGLLTAADEMKNMANDMAHAREEISKVTISHEQTADAVDKLGDAATDAAEQLLNVPNIFRYRARLVEQWDPRDLPGNPVSPFNPPTPPAIPVAPPQLVVVPQAVPLLEAPPRVPTTAPASAQPVQVPPSPNAGAFIVQGDLVIQTSGDGAETLDNLERERARRAMATYGLSTATGGVYQGQ